MTTGKTNKSLIETALEKVARILSDRYDIQVFFSGDECRTTGRVIYLPAIPDDCSPELLGAIEGYLDHEVGHIIFDDFAIINEIQDPLTQAWANVFFDARIPRQMGGLWKGCEANLREAGEYVFEKRVLPTWKKASRSFNLLRSAGLYAEGEEEKLALLPDIDEYLEKLEPLKPALDLAAEQPDTLHSLALACWVVRTMGHEPVLGKIPGKEELEGLMGSLVGVPGRSTSGEMEGMEEAAKELAKEFAKSPEELKKMEEEFRSELTSAIKRELRSARPLDITAMPDFYLPYSTENDKIEVVPKGNPKIFNKDVVDVRKNAGVLTRHLRASLVSRAQSVTEYDKESGAPNPRAFCRLLTTGYPKVFKRKSIGEVLNVRASLLIDQSGSMRWGSKIIEARRTAVLFGDFLDILQIPFEVLGFSSVSFEEEEQRYEKASEEDKKRFTRWGDLRIDIYKQFHESFKKVGHRFSHMKDQCHNYDGEAVRFAAQRLLRAQTDKKERLLLFVMSDGQPEQAIGHFDQHHKKFLRRVIAEIVHRGVEVVGIGICSHAVENYYPDSIVVQDPAKLMGAQFLKLKELLTKNKGMGKRSRRAR